jgi:hypothetical protein
MAMAISSKEIISMKEHQWRNVIINGVSAKWRGEENIIIEK